MDWRAALLVGAGGALGAVARFAASSLATKPVFPWPTLAVNLLGSFILGAFFLQPSESGWRLFVGVGFLGAFTTLSTFSVETVHLLRTGSGTLAAANVAANAAGGPLLAWAGYLVASR